MKITLELLNKLMGALAYEYAERLAAFPMKKQVREAFADGFRAGAHSGARHVCAVLGVEVEK